MEVIGYRHTGEIDIILNGVQMTVPDDPGNRHRQMLAEWEAAGNMIPPYMPEPELEPITIVYPVDLWSRMTDVEADAVVQAMTTQTVRIQNIFRAASSYRSDHELWPLLVSVATSLFGSERAAEILAAS